MNDNIVYRDDKILYNGINSTLFTLDNINFTDIHENIKKFNPHSDCSDKTFESIKTILRTFKSDSSVYHSTDIEVVLHFYYLIEDSVAFWISSDYILFPFIDETHFYVKIDVNKLNVMTSYCFPKIPLLVSMIDNKLIKTIKKIDSFLDYNNELITLIVHNGLSSKTKTVYMDLFEIECNENSINFRSVLKGFFESQFEMPFFNIHVHDNQCSIMVSGQMISLTEQEFLDTDNDELISIIMRLLKIKKLPISCMSHLKDYLLVKKMENI